MSEVSKKIRPRAQYLKQLNTLARRNPGEGELPGGDALAVTWELKLETPEVRWWLCTEGLAQPQPGMPKCWVADYIAPEYSTDDGNWRLEETEAYGPQSTAWLQGNDYLQMLADECERLQQQYEQESNWQFKQQLEITQEEMRQVIAQLDAIVEQKQPEKV